MHGYSSSNAKKNKLIYSAQDYNGAAGDMLVFENDDGSAHLFY